MKSRRLRSVGWSGLAVFAVVVSSSACDSFESSPCEGAACNTEGSNQQEPGENEGIQEPGGAGGSSSGGGGGGAAAAGEGGGGSGDFPAIDEPGVDQGGSPVDEPIDEPIEAPGDDPIDDPVDDPIDDPGDDPIDDPGDDPIDDPGDDPVDDPAGNEWVTADMLDELELERIDELRDAIFDGLGVGRDHYLESISLVLLKNNVVDDYESVLVDGWQTLQVGFSNCPFAEFYDNAGADVVNCEYLAQLAKVEAYSDLGAILDVTALPKTIKPENLEDAHFWQEQGAISGIEEQRVVVMADLAVQGFCNQVPKPVESSAAKGYLLGRQLLIGKINNWLASQGHTPDYPTVSSKIQVCAINAAALDPAKKAAKNGIADVLADKPLCPGYAPPTIASQLQFAQAELDYKKAIEKGIEDEFSLAAVKVFQVVPCAVSDPLVVDVDGDGIELIGIARGVDFDLWATGRSQAVAWVAPDDGLLVLDRDGDGRVASGADLFGDVRGEAGDGFADLAMLDDANAGGNGDGVVDATDAGWHELQIWRDLDTNGVSEPSELTHVSALGITALPIKSGAVSLRSAGNDIGAVAMAPTSSGSILIGDAYLYSAPYPRLSYLSR